MKIVLINYEFPPLGGGGGYASECLAREMVKLGHEVHVLTSAFIKLPNKERRHGVFIHRMPTLRLSRERCSIFEMSIYLLISLFWAPLKIKKLKPDITLSFFSIPCGPAAWLANKLFGYPYAIALRGGDVPGFLPNQLSFFHRLLASVTRRIWKDAKFVTANSKGLAELAETFFPEISVKVISNGIEAIYFVERDFKHDSVIRPLKVLTVGRLSEQKQIGRQIESMKRLHQHGHKNIELHIAGDGPLRDELESQARDAGILDETVFFHGWLIRQDLLHLYKNAHVFSLTSDYEGMSNALLEAMAAGLPAVATQAPGTNELVDSGKNGFLIKNNQLTDLDSSFLRLRDNPDELLSMANKAREMASGYTWQKTAALFLGALGKTNESHE